MKRTRRIVVTGAVVAGALGGAGLALTGSPAGAGVATVTMSTPAVPAADTRAGAVAQLDALAGQLARAERGLQGQFVAATRDEERAKQLHDAALREAASRATQARAQAAQQAADQAAAAQAAAAQAGTTMPVAGPGVAPTPQVHATTRASGAASSGGDDGRSGDDGGGGGDD